MTTRSGVFCAVLLSLTLAAGTAQAQPAADADEAVARAASTIEQGYYGDALQQLASPGLRDVAEAQALLGDLYLRGLGVPQNFGTAMDYYRRAAGLGSAAAQNALGRAYAEGQAIPRDAQRAFEYLTEAAMSGVPGYQSDLARALETGVGGEQASEAGDARAQNNLGLIYVRGEDVERDYDLAFELFSVAAEQGQREALTNLSVMYASGFGVDVDEAQSVRLLEQARRARGLTLSTLLEQVGFPYDARLAEQDWSLPLSPANEQAARGGDPVALYLTALRYLNGAGVRQDIPVGVERMQRAADLGMGTAQFMLGLMYAHGRNLPQDYGHAYVWTSRAALAAVPGAAEVRDALAAEMGAAQLRQAQQRVAASLDRAQ